MVGLGLGSGNEGLGLRDSRLGFKWREQAT